MVAVYPEKSSSDLPDATSTALEPIQTTFSRRSVATIQQEDDEDFYETVERAASVAGAGAAAVTKTRTGATITSVASRMPDFEVVFSDDAHDPENPKDWPVWYRAWVMVVVAYNSWLVVLYSTSYTASTPGLAEEFNVSPTIVTLGLTTYLLGLACGSLLVAPLSELYGRQLVYLISFIAWTLLIIPCGLATSLTTLLVVRFIAALFGAAFISNGPGSVVDVSRPEYLAFYLSMWSIAPLNSPTFGPLIGGFVFQYLGWRWTHWIVLILAGAGIAMQMTCKETYAPILLKRKAARLRRETGDDRWWCQYDMKLSTVELVKLNLSRPFTLAAREPILWFMNVWIPLVYGVLYLGFVAYPIVFRQERHFSPGQTGLAFLGIGVGTIFAIVSEPLIRKFINAQPRNSETGKVEPESVAMIMAVGSVATCIGQLGFAWTCLPVTIHPIVPILFGIPFGLGNTLSFIYGANYMAGCYKIYSASALAGNTVMRSIFGAVLPLAAPRMYAALTPQWAGTLLGLLEVLMVPIPFVFWRYGARIRARSPVLRELREQEEDDARRKARAGVRRTAQLQHVVEDSSTEERDTRAEGDKGGTQTSGKKEEA
ncbi:major facilitator superfamily domain-containing protein [Stachybotrys elegans]|uniref:Major facilitator superfamily domain-containing protein n=1 Tax=Stachybotrys elegans TaxID=80388 RepID=A0A8K0WVI3_9HYPO|nr:major facilitator superfamily domain-containing protein [Stachybotrys elegans]